MVHKITKTVLLCRYQMIKSELELHGL